MFTHRGIPPALKLLDRCLCLALELCVAQHVRFVPSKSGTLDLIPNPAQSQASFADICNPAPGR